MSKGKRKNSSRSIINGAEGLIEIIEMEGGKICIGRMYQTGNNNNGNILIKILNESDRIVDLKFYSGTRNFQQFRVISPLKYDIGIDFLKYCASKIKRNIRIKY